MALADGWLKVTAAWEPMLKVFQSRAALALPCWICIAAPLCPIVAWPATMRPPVGSVVGAIDCALLSRAGALSASATAVARILFFGICPPQSCLKHCAYLHPKAAGRIRIRRRRFSAQLVRVPGAHEDAPRARPFQSQP